MFRYRRPGVRQKIEAEQEIGDWRRIYNEFCLELYGTGGGFLKG